MKAVSARDLLVCPVCEGGVLGRFGRGHFRCGSCGLLFNSAVGETLREIVELPDAAGEHACECGHPEMRLLPGGIYRCPACGAEVLPVDCSGGHPCPEGEGCGSCA